jgi:AcrR family transcriptional regulator
MPRTTRRERKKADKLRRIRSSARELFAEQGFDATSTRQIADQAGVGLATLFLYASDKRDLLFLACNDDLDRLTESGFADVDTAQPLLDQLATALRHFFIFFKQNARLSQDLLRELTFYTSGQHSARFQGIRRRTIQRIADLIEAAKKRGEVGPTHPTALAAEVLFFVFAAHVRKWLGGAAPKPEEGVQQLRRLYTVILDGLVDKPRRGVSRGASSRSPIRGR